MKPLTLEEIRKACLASEMTWPADSADAPFVHDIVSLAIMIRGDEAYAAFHRHWRDRGLAFFQEHYGAPLGFVIDRANQVLATLAD